MKKYIRAVRASFFAALCMCFILACQNPFDPLSDGEGTFSLINDEVYGRTIMPATVQSSFALYTLVFSSSGRNSVSVDRTNATLTSSVTLAAATWNLTVTAYMDSGKTRPAAQGSLTGIVISAGANVSRSLELKPVIESGAKGTFSWNIGYPTEVTAASVKITPLDSSGTPAQTLYFIGGTPSVNKNNTSSPLSLNTGYYQVIFSLSNGQHSTGREEYLHIYKNMDSRFEYTFSQDHLTVYSVTNGADSGPGSLRHAIANAASDSTILVESSVGTIQLTSRLSISKNLTIAGNGVTITRAPSWTTIGYYSGLLYISSTVTINRVHFKDGRSTGYGAAINFESCSVNLESCIFSGNQSNEAGGSIYIYNGNLNVKGCTFYGNSSDSLGGAICGNSSSSITLTGNLFYGNTAALITHPVLMSSGTVTSNGYNVVDVPLGSGLFQSGWVAHGTDKVVNSLPIETATFKVISGSGAHNIITSRPGGYPATDFYGNPIPASKVSAGAVQAAVIDHSRVTNGNNDGVGSLRQAIANVPSGSTILVESSVGTIQLTSRLEIYKSLTIAGNGVTITRDPSWTAIDSSSQLLYISDSSTTVTISRTHFKDGRASNGSAVYIYLSSVNLESCIFSGNHSNSLGNIYCISGNMTIKGCTFYGNSTAGTYGGAIYAGSSLTLTGNLFYGNTAASGYHVLRPNGTVTSNGYNVVDAPLGTGSTQSGWAAHSTDKTVSSMPIEPATFRFFRISSGAHNIITSRPGGYPATDFYGNPIPATYAAAGAVQATSQIQLADNPSVIRVPFTDKTTTVSLSGLSGKNIYLVKINTSNSTVSAANTGNVLSLSRNLANNDTPPPAINVENLPRMGHPGADRFYENLPPIDNKTSQSGLYNTAPFIPPVVGNTRMFWLEIPKNNWIQKQATLRATGTRGNIWVMDNSITTADAQKLASKFDTIYPAETNLLGFEYGGGPGGDGGKDRDPKIQILVYDIGGDTLGYFHPKDFYEQSELTGVNAGLKTNLAEIFYIDSGYVNSNIDLICSTLVHEFQHMINFNEKSVKRRVESSRWYDEMLSLMAEDVIEDIIGIDPTHEDHIIKDRIPIFLSFYNGLSFTIWYINDVLAINYSKGYAFGAYLLRNYGGAALLKNILANNSVDIDSITAALNDFSPGMDFNTALMRFGEAMIFSGAQKTDNVITFDKTVTNTINGFTYTAYGFDIWKISRWDDDDGYGPYVLNLSQAEMRSHSVSLHQAPEWKNKTGNFSVTLEKPANPGIELFLMVR